MVGSNIRNLRGKKKLTQGDLAGLLGVSRQAICMWEADKRELRATMLRRIAKVFRVSVNELVKPERVTPIQKEEEMAKAIETRKRVDFELAASSAKSVILTGDFNAWDKGSLTMRRGKDGKWKTSVNLKPGRYQYKYIVDGQWWTDPSNKNIVTNSLGSTNSLMDVSSK